jgi:RHS repeat-associated protein
MLDENSIELLSLSLGNKLYELSNHLGNVLTVINDLKLPLSSNSVDVDGYLATIVSTADYSPFGSPMPGRTYNNTQSPNGFNGQRKDEEIYGSGNCYDFGARIYDSRIARFLSIDPKTKEFPYWSPYLFAANNPNRMVDVYGEGPGDRVKKAKSMVGTPYKQETTSSLRTGETKEALEFMDCAEFVCRVLAADKITPKIEHMTSSGLKKFLDNKQQFVHSQTPQVGDIAVWDGHVGIVTSVDKDGKIKLTHARGAGKLAQENPYHITSQQYRSSTFHGYYRPINENDNSQNNTTTTPTTPATTQQADDNTIYNGGTLPEVVIVGQRTTTSVNSGARTSGSTTETTEQP